MNLDDQSEFKIALAAARDSLPDLDVDQDSFLAYLVRFIDPAEPVSSIHKLEIRDLYLTFACLRGDEHALLLFEDEYIPLIRRNIGKLNINNTSIEEIIQRFRYKLLVRLKEHEPKLTLYNGTSKLSSWLRVVALREALDFVKAKERKELPLTDADLADQIAPQDQEIKLIRRQYQFEFETVLKDALKNLDTRERNLLRASALDKLTIDEIGDLYQVHRATAARWLVKIRLKLKTQIKKRLKNQLNLDTCEYDEIADALNSQLSLSLSRILAP